MPVSRSSPGTAPRRGIRAAHSVACSLCLLAAAPVVVACGHAPSTMASQVSPRSPPAETADPSSAANAGTGVWIPPPGTTWQWQLAGSPIDLTVEADAFDLDLFETPAELVAALHARGARVICYLSAGSWEDWRPDAGDFPDEVIGSKYEGWPGERWLDVRRIDLLAPILIARLELCRDKGFDAVEPDNIDGYANDTGFPITPEDQLAFNRWLAEEAHALGLSIGLKNDPEQAAQLVEAFDWALTEDCFDEAWCEAMTPFLNANKAVFTAEYSDTGVDFDRACEQLVPAGFSPILKERELTAWRQTCGP